MWLKKSKKEIYIKFILNTNYFILYTCDLQYEIYNKRKNI